MIGGMMADVVRVGLYMTDTQYDNMKSAFLADWENGGDANTFGKWIAVAIKRYAKLPVARRIDIAKVVAPQSRLIAGGVKSFSVPAKAIEAMKHARLADTASGVIQTKSEWLRSAIELAVQYAKAANGGVLPEPPAKLVTYQLRRSGGDNHAREN